MPGRLSRSFVVGLPFGWAAIAKVWRTSFCRGFALFTLLSAPPIAFAGPFATVAGGPTKATYGCHDWDTCATHSTGYVLTAGYHFTIPWGVEAKWIDFGTADSKETDLTTTISHNTVRDSGPAIGFVYDSGPTQLPISLRFSLGFTHLTSSIVSTTRSGAVDQRRTVDVPYMEGSFGYDFAPHWTVSAGVLFLNLDDVVGNSVTHVIDLVSVRMAF